jgi:hypothetical protein
MLRDVSDLFDAANAKTGRDSIYRILDECREP